MTSEYPRLDSPITMTDNPHHINPGRKMAFFHPRAGSNHRRRGHILNLENIFEFMIDFLCIGAQKAGTTWLIANIKAHPGVWTPKFIKELHYFDAVHLKNSKRVLMHRYEVRGGRMVEKFPEQRAYIEKVLDPEFAFTDEWYAHIFSAAPKRALKGECTPLYCAINDEGVAHVKLLMPGVRLIYLIRDPFDRAMSSLRMEMDHAKTTRGSDMLHLLDQELFVRRGDYRRNIPRWERAFDPSQILYIPFGRVKSDPQRVLGEVENHLGLPVFAKYPKLGKQINQTRKEGIVIGDEVLAGIKRMVEPQYEFLAERFGDSFLESTK